MGKQKLSDFIRKIDFLGAKPDGEYGNRKDDPCQQLKDFASQCENITFEELKDAFTAFEEKVCVRDFPAKKSPAFRVANTTIGVLKDRTSTMKKNNEALTSQLTQVAFHTLVTMMKAGPGSTHSEMMKVLFSFKNNGVDLEAYAKTLEPPALLHALTAAKVTFEYSPNSYFAEEEHAALQNDNLKKYILMFTAGQFKTVQKEFLEIYGHCYSQLSSVSEKYMYQIYYLIRDMADNFEEKNPYLNLKDPDIIQKHIDIVKNLVCSQGYTYKTRLDEVTSKILNNLLTATLKDGIVAEVFDHLMDILIDICRNDSARLQAEEIFNKYRIYLFDDMASNKMILPKPCYISCGNMILALLGIDQIKTNAEVKLLEAAVKDVVMVTKLEGLDDVKLALQTVGALLRSGRVKLIEISQKLLESMKKGKTLDWKSHINEAGKIINVVADIPKKLLQDDSNSDLRNTTGKYRGFIKKFFEMLKKGKIILQVQSSIVHLFFTSLYADTQGTMEYAYECSEFLDFSKDPKLRLEALSKCETLVLEMDTKEMPVNDWRFSRAVGGLMTKIIDSYNSGTDVTVEENKLFISIFTFVGVGEDSIEEQFYQEDNVDCPNAKHEIWQGPLNDYASLHEGSKTLACLAPVMPELIKWAKIAAEENHKGVLRLTFDPLSTISKETPVEFKEYLPDIIELMLETQRVCTLDGFIMALYPHNSTAVHNKLEDLFQSLDDMKEYERSYILCMINEIAQVHPEVFTISQLSMLIDQYPNRNQHEQGITVIVFKHIAEKTPSSLIDLFPRLCDDSIFKPETLNFRQNVIECVGGVNQKLGQQAVDYLMKYSEYPDGMIAFYVVQALNHMMRKQKDYMQKYKSKLEKISETANVPGCRDLAHNMVLVLEGKSVEKIAEDVQQQQEDMADLDEKVDATIDTVINIGDKVIEHDMEIGELGEELERVEERVDDVDTDLTNAKIKVEEIDCKTMSNAPKWSRDLTKLMNPTTENDWRLLASRLGYSNDDIRSWATQHDPCMALLSEWYATHKTSEATFGVLTALTEMNRTDGVAIVENAMKAAEDVVEDEGFEYASPPPIFISYQWGFQNEVKLLKHHLKMAGYECWLDVGQMGGGDKLFAKIDNGIRGAKTVICCVTEKYAKSPNCNREVNLAVNLNKPIIPLLMEKMDWPPVGSMGPIFSEYLFIRFFQRDGEETKDSDQRYWPIPKFHELLMQLNFSVVPDTNMIEKEYANWWAPMTEDIVIDKTKDRKQEQSLKSNEDESQVVKSDESPLVFLSYQWSKQTQIMALYKRFTSLGYSVWMDIYQMGGGDSLYDKIDRGIRGCKAVIPCVTQKYSLSANCRREISLADALKKPIIPILLEQMKWPPDGPMSMVFTELLYINCYEDEKLQITWKGEKFDELTEKLRQYVPVTKSSQSRKDKPKPVSNNKTSDPITAVSNDGNSLKNEDNVTRRAKNDETSDSVQKRIPQAQSSLGNKNIVSQSARLGNTATENGISNKKAKYQEQENSLNFTGKNKHEDNKETVQSTALDESNNESKVSGDNAPSNSPSKATAQYDSKSKKTISNDAEGNNANNQLRETDANSYSKINTDSKSTSVRKPNATSNTNQVEKENADANQSDDSYAKSKQTGTEGGQKNKSADPKMTHEKKSKSCTVL